VGATEAATVLDQVVDSDAVAERFALAECLQEVVELIELADGGLLDIARSRKVEQEVLDLIDEPTPR
jgi:hypothetical protein